MDPKKLPKAPAESNGVQPAESSESPAVSPGGSPNGSSGVSPDVSKRTRPAESGRGKRALSHSRYTEQEIERGMVALALFSGNRRRASEALKQQGLDVPETTLRNWRNSQPGRYFKLQRDVLPELRARAAESHSELAELEGATARKLLARLDAEHKNIPVRDLPGAVRNLDVGQGIHRDKAALLRGEGIDAPATSRSFKEILAALRAKGVDPRKLTLTQSVEVEAAPDPPREDAIDGTAEEQSED